MESMTAMKATVAYLEHRAHGYVWNCRLEGGQQWQICAGKWTLSRKMTPYKIKGLST